MPDKPDKPDNIRDVIVAKRRERIARLGHSEGAAVPQERSVPLTPFLRESGLICEVKRRSPSKGDIAPGLDAVAQAGVYADAGAGNLSVLTEPTGFAGSLDDLMQVKRAHPGLAVLRKDFLFDVEDIDVSFRAGADAVLLIAGMLSGEQLAAMHARAAELGMSALVELHDTDDCRKAAPFSPPLVGVNSRDLRSFRVDPLLPLRVKAAVTWSARVVYESGVRSAEQAAFAVSAGFSGLLVGEGVVRSPSLAGQLLAAMRGARPARFWSSLARRQNEKQGRPLVKVCGLTREADARLAADLGADALGFVFWDGSQRRAQAGLLAHLRDLDVLKVAVTVNAAGAGELLPEVRQLLADGLLDAVQLHGSELPADCARLWPVNYKALRPAAASDVPAADAFLCPRVLLDASAALPGGTGTRVSSDVLAAWGDRPLWLAGGISPGNVGRIIAEARPELLDLASGVEASPGVKDAGRLREFFREVGNTG